MVVVSATHGVVHVVRDLAVATYKEGSPTVAAASKELTVSEVLLCTFMFAQIQSHV
jgi:hypothetical protein